MVAHVVSSARFGLESCLAGLGVDPGMISSSSPADIAKSTKQQTIPLSMFADTLEAAARLADRPDLGLLFAQSFDMRSFGALGHLMHHAATIHESFRAYVRFYGRIQSDTEVALETFRGEASVSYAVNDSSIKNSRQDAEFSTGILLRFASTVSGRSCSEGSLRFSHAAPSTRSVSSRSVPFALRPVFNAPSNSVGFPEEYLAFRNPLADPELAEIFSAHLERQPSVSDAGGSGFVKALEQVIREEATRGRGIAIQDCARLLGTSVRGLQRDCAAQGLSFRDIRNDVFMMLASEWLRSTDLSITDIALKLGFSESSSFSRAFRNHAGHSPSHLRRRAAAEGFK